MNEFKIKYPTYSQLLALVGAEAKELADPSQTIVQKLTAQLGLLPQIVEFIPEASALKAESEALKSSPADIEGGVELLVTDLAFSNAKAQAVIQASFALAEWIVGGVAPIEGLVLAIKA